MRIYIAGSTKEFERAEAFAASLTDAGHVVTSTWFAHVREVGTSNVGVPANVAVRAARQCETEIRAAELLVALLPAPSICSRGMFWELGLCRGIGRETVVVGERERVERSVFAWLADGFAIDEATALRLIASPGRRP